MNLNEMKEPAITQDGVSFDKPYWEEYVDSQFEIVGQKHGFSG